MPRIEFEAPEYQSDGSFKNTAFVYEGDEQNGWSLKRDGAAFLELGPGYTPIQSAYCGVCSTDLARRFLPYPLPQIIGHEVVGKKDGQLVVIEINASHHARAVQTDCPYCTDSMNTQCPHRITLGIDRLPGGFAPFLLAPVNALIPVPKSIPPIVAALTEPFAAALQGVEATAPRNGDRVAVLGPRRLGALIIAALAGYRNKTNRDFEICAIARHDSLLSLSEALGADTVIDTRTMNPEELAEKFDVVFDTTGKPEGFAAALAMTRRVLHLKSTNGQEVMGVSHLTDMVVDEIALVPATEEQLGFTWPGEKAEGKGERKNPNIYVGMEVDQGLIETMRGDAHQLKQMPYSEAEERILEKQDEYGATYPPGSPYPRFDLGVAGSLKELDRILRPTPGREVSLVRARGAVLYGGSDDESELARSIRERGIEIHTSRCGSFERALEILDSNPGIVNAIETHMITHRFPLSDLANAFEVAADSSQSVKVVVETGA